MSSTTRKIRVGTIRQRKPPALSLPHPLSGLIPPAGLILDPVIRHPEANMRYALMHAVLLCVTAAPTSAAAQARIEALHPDASSFRVERLASFIEEPADTGMDLLPGDLLTSSASETLLEMSCPAGSNNSFRLDGPFRVLIDAPRDTVCHVNLLGGGVDVLAETSTSVTAGGVEMGSVSTQYAVRLEGSGSAVTPKLIVFDGKVLVSTYKDVRSS